MRVGHELGGAPWLLLAGAAIVYLEVDYIVASYDDLNVPPPESSAFQQQMHVFDQSIGAAWPDSVAINLAPRAPTLKLLLAAQDLAQNAIAACEDMKSRIADTSWQDPITQQQGYVANIQAEANALYAQISASADDPADVNRAGIKDLIHRLNLRVMALEYAVEVGVANTPFNNIPGQLGVSLIRALGTVAGSIGNFVNAAGAALAGLIDAAAKLALAIPAAVGTVVDLFPVLFWGGLIVGAALLGLKLVRDLKRTLPAPTPG